MCLYYRPTYYVMSALSSPVSPVSASSPALIDHFELSILIPEFLFSTVYYSLPLIPKKV